MTINELIEKLKAFPPDMRVMTPGFDESGYSDIGEPEVLEIALDAYSGNHCGEHEELQYLPSSIAWKGETCNAVVIGF